MDQPVRRTRVGAYVVCARAGDLLLVRYAHSRRWTLPGGGLDHGEDPRDAAVREVAEETGLAVVLGRLIEVHSTRWDRSHDGRPVDVHAVRIVYTAEVTGGTLRDEVGGSTDRAAWVPIGEVAGLDRSGIVRVALDAVGHPAAGRGPASGVG